MNMPNMPISIEDFIGALESDLRKGEYTTFSNKISDAFVQIINTYNAKARNVREGIGRDFKEFVAFKVTAQYGDREQAIDPKKDTAWISNIVVEPTKLNIDNLAIKLKAIEESMDFENLPDSVRPKAKETFSDHVGILHQAEHNFYVEVLTSYRENLAYFYSTITKMFGLMDELEEHAKTNPGLLGSKGSKRVYNDRKKSLLKDFKAQYGTMRELYGHLTGDKCVSRSIDSNCMRIGHMTKVASQKEWAEEQDPKPNIFVTENSPGTYEIYMTSSNQLPLYEGKLALNGNVSLQNGFGGTVGIDLSADSEGHYFSVGAGERTAENSRLLTIKNIPEGVKLTGLEVVGSYRLPYIRSTETVRKNLIQTSSE